MAKFYIILGKNQYLAYYMYMHKLDKLDDGEQDEKYVFHGSHEKFDLVQPKRNRRIKVQKDGTKNVTFDKVSFHATPYKWIALAYTYAPKTFELGDKLCYYNMGVSLYENKKEIEIMGHSSLEESLEKLYGDGGYLFYFEKEKFSHKEGLGDLEVIIMENIIPYKIERIDNPVEILREMGINFIWTDLTKPQNAQFQNFK